MSSDFLILFSIEHACKRKILVLTNTKFILDLDCCCWKSESESRECNLHNYISFWSLRMSSWPSTPRRLFYRHDIEHSKRGQLHGELSTLGLNSALLTGLKFFAITWTISTPGLKRYTIRSWHRFPLVKKPLFCFLVINSHYHVCSNKSW
jgi:hypothetical protein